MEVKATARQIYDELEVAEADRLELSNGWLGRFQKRHGLKLHRRHSENLEVSGVDIEEERKRIQKEVAAFLKEREGKHSLDDVWTMEMTTVLLECSPMKVAHVGSGGRKRITIGLAVNASGTERLEPIFVGHENVHPSNFQYYFNNRIACMTPGIFSEFLHAWNENLVEINRQVLLLVDQSWGSLRDEMKFSNVQLRSFPASFEEHLQPFRLGLTKAFHTQFLKLVAHRALSKLRGSQDGIADCNTPFQMDDVDAMELAKAAWQLTAPGLKLAACCWRKAQIFPAAANAAEVSALIEADAYVSIAVDEELAKLEQALQVLVLEASSRQLS